MNGGAAYSFLGIAPGASPADVHRAAAAKLAALSTDGAQGRYDPAYQDQAHTAIYRAVADILGLRLGLNRDIDEVGYSAYAMGWTPPVPAGDVMVAASQAAYLSERPAEARWAGPRLPFECESCGWFPAVPLSAMRRITLIIWSHGSRDTKALCRDCSRRAIRRAQIFTVCLGCFGFGIVLSSIALTKNALRLAALNSFPAPYARRPGVLAPRVRPHREGLPVMVWLGIMAAILVVCALGAQFE
jgi:hypothetical protein